MHTPQFTADEYRDQIVNPICSCGHLAEEHLSIGCYAVKLIAARCGCERDEIDVRAAAIDQLVREKIATELDRMSDEIRPYRNTIRERAEEIRRG